MVEQILRFLLLNVTSDIINPDISIIINDSIKLKGLISGVMWPWFMILYIHTANGLAFSNQKSV
ncbi:hypothetical protein MZ16F93_44430 [Escherichia coli]